MEKQAWEQGEKKKKDKMSNTPVSAFQKVSFESSVLSKVLTHPWHFSASTFTPKNSKLLYGKEKTEVALEGSEGLIQLV